MKIRHPLAIRWIGFVGALLIRLWMGTCTFRYRPTGRNLDPRRPLPRRSIFVFYHEYLLAPPAYSAHRRIAVLISQHADGEIIAQAIEHLGFSTVRGSTTRGGVEALRRMIRLGETHHIAVIPDGPRGPRRKVEAGLAYLASTTGMPIILVGVAYVDCWRFNTWDKFALPKPFSDLYFTTSDMIAVPPNLTRPELEQVRADLEEQMRKVNDVAEEGAKRLRERRRGWFWFLRRQDR